MNHQDILNLRLRSLQLHQSSSITPAQVVSRLGAIQAQDYEGAKWSIALRTRQKKHEDVEKAIHDRLIVRTWPMRGTLHFIASEDVRWMLKLLSPRIISKMDGRNKQLELGDAVFDKAQDVLVNAMQGGVPFTRAQVYSLLELNGISTSNQRGIHIINYLAQTQIICHGPHSDKQATYVLLNEWIPASLEYDYDEALAKIALKYFKGHGPATLQDFIWWTGLKVTEARIALNFIRTDLTREEVNGETYWFTTELRDSLAEPNPISTLLLPGFDEYMLGYTNRLLMVDAKHLNSIVPGNNGMFMPTVVIDGKVQALWKKQVKSDKVLIELALFKKLSISQLKQISNVAHDYASYLNKELVLKV